MRETLALISALHPSLVYTMRHRQRRLIRLGSYEEPQHL